MGRTRERYSKVKNDHYLNQKIVDEANTFGPFDKVVYYEKAFIKKDKTAVRRTVGRCFELHRDATMALGSLWNIK